VAVWEIHTTHLQTEGLSNVNHIPGLLYKNGRKCTDEYGGKSSHSSNNFIDLRGVQAVCSQSLQHPFGIFGLPK